MLELVTKRLILNSFTVTDADRVASLAGDKRVVDMTASIPYPYKTAMAISWIKTHKEQEDQHKNYIFAIRLKSTSELIGCINIGFNERHDRGVVGYWLGHDFWGNGYCTEALQEIIEFGFQDASINKIWAEHKTFNIGSGRVMEKVGMKHEGIMRNHYKQEDDEYLDMSIKSILRSEYVKI